MIRRPPRSTLLPYPTPFRSTATSSSSRTARKSAPPRSGSEGPFRGAASAAAARPSGRHQVADGERLALQQRGQLRSEEHTSELQSRQYLVCRLLLEKKKEKR